MQNRVPDFRSFDEVIYHVTQLQSTGYKVNGNWSLGQICNHLAESIDLMSGRAMRWVPRIAQQFFATAFLRFAFVGRFGRMLGLRMPTVLPQRKPVEDAVGVQRLEEAFARLEELTPHLIGFHLWHTRHHLMFLDTAAEAGSVDRHANNGQASLV
ncbi:MAG: DUF1569 domain-containing protein [Planctomycetota bacterium]